MTKLDLKNVNITSEKDWESLEKEWNSYYNYEKFRFSFDPYRKLLSNLNVIVGFGRGFWGGVDDYFYLVFHQETKKFYWYLRDIDEDTEVYFYEVNERAKILQLLQTTSIDGNFQEYNKVLNYDLLFDLSIGKTDELPENMKKVTLTELFGEDTEQLRIALMYFQPAGESNGYPHDEFEERFFFPHVQNEMDQEIDIYNNSTFHVFRKDEKMYITLNNDTFELKKV